MMPVNETIKLALLDSWKGNAGQGVAVLAERTAGVGLTIGVNRRYRGGALKGDEESECLAVKVTRRGSVRVERWVRPRRGKTGWGNQVMPRFSGQSAP